MVKNLPAVQETQVQFLGQEDPLEKGIPTHTSVLAWKIPWTKVPGGLQSMGFTELKMTEQIPQNKKKKLWRNTKNTKYLNVIFRKKNKAGGIRFPDFTLYYKIAVIRTVLY